MKCYRVRMVAIDRATGALRGLAKTAKRGAIRMRLFAVALRGGRRPGQWGERALMRRWNRKAKAARRTGR